MSRSTDRRVAVVGAGFCGLTAAYELAKSGLQVDLYEAAPTVGGLASGFTLDNGLPLERAYHFAYTTDRYLIDMATELGIADRLHFYPSSITAHVGEAAFPFNTAMDLLRFTPLSMFDRLRSGFTALRLMGIRDWRPLTGVTAYDWLCRVNGQRATDLIWKPLLVGKFDTSWDGIAMSWLWSRIRQRQTSRVAGDRRQHLGYFDGGFGVLVERWMEELDRLGVGVETGTPVTAMDGDAGRPALTIKGRRIGYDDVLVTLPSHVFARTAAGHPQMTPDYAAHLNSVDYLAAVIMIIVTTGPITDTYWHQIHDLDAPFLVMLSLDALIGTDATRGRHVCYIGDYVANDDPLLAATDEELRDRWFPALQRLLPRFSSDSVEEYHVFRFRNAQHVVGLDYPSKVPSMTTPLDGYHLANFTQIFPEDRGTNYAIRDGLAATRLITRRLGQ